MRSMRLCCINWEKQISMRSVDLNVWIQTSDRTTNDITDGGGYNVFRYVEGEYHYSSDAKTFWPRSPSGDRCRCLQLGRLSDPDPRIWWRVLASYFSSRTMKVNELNYRTVENKCWRCFVSWTCVTLCWSQVTLRYWYDIQRWHGWSWGLNVRLVRWAALLSNWSMEVKKCEKAEDEILGALATSIPRERKLKRCWSRSLHENIVGTR